MGNPTVLKGVYKDGSVVASVVQQDSNAKIMLKGAEPNLPGDPAFKEGIKKATQACWEHIEKFEHRELCAVLVARPGQAEHVDLTAEDIKAMGLERVNVMDGDCGIVVRVCENTPPAVPLAYASLRAGSGPLCIQPGRVDVPAALIRKTHKELTPPQKQVYEIAVQMAADSLQKLVCVEDEGLKMVLTVRDLPPARARSIMFPLGAFADDLGRGAPPEEIAKRLVPVRGV